jgi:hypothetical protein
MHRRADDSYALSLDPTEAPSAPVSPPPPIVVADSPAAIPAFAAVHAKAASAVAVTSRPSDAVSAIVASTDPFPVVKDPFPVVKDPFPIPKDPFPVPKYPFPTPKDPFNPGSSPTSPPSPVAPVPVPTQGNLPVTPAQLDQSDVAVEGPQARASGLTGAGIKIGIMSNSFNILGFAAANEATGLLPNVTVLQDGQSGDDDEGRAMAELVHATAPNAQLYFYSADNGLTGFADGVAALQAAGCQIIVDDVQYGDEPMFQQAGPLDSAINNAVASGVDYFSAAGNNGTTVYQAAVAPQTVTIAGIGKVAAQTFGGATTQAITAAAGSQESLYLEWDAPYDAVNPDAITVEVLSGSSVVATSTQIGSEPVVALDLPYSASDATYNVAIIYNTSVPLPGVFKYELQGNHGIIDNTAGGEATGAVYGHQMLPGINAVGAIDVTDTPSQGGTLAPEYFSNSGGSQFLLAPDGSLLATPQTSPSPEFAAPDGSDTSVFQPFYGTSAAAPVAAAVAALMLQADPRLTTTDITALLEDSALPTPSSDDAAGAGLIQANLAASFASTGVIAGSQQTVIQGISGASTIQGGSGSHEFIAGSGATVIEPEASTAVIVFGTGDDTALLGSGSAVLNVIDGSDGGFDAINNFNPAADTLQLTGFDAAAAGAAIADQYQSGGDTWVKLPDGTALAFVGLDHLSSANVTYNGATLAASLACFAEGTRIATGRGQVPVEALHVGDRVLGPWGETMAVRWLGHRRVDCARHPRPEAVQPVKVRAGAFRPGVPSRDLYLSPDHALFIAPPGMRPVLIPVHLLIDGDSVVRQTVARVTYWHVELERHAVLLAEGLPCESYLDTGNRADFDNGGPAVRLHPEFAATHWDARACAPQARGGPALDWARSWLAARRAEAVAAMAQSA